jgi:hypothetical protein
MSIKSVKNKTRSGSLLIGNPPFIPTSFESIQTITGSGSSLSFTSIPSTYKHLQIRGISRDGSDSAVVAQFNGDTSTSNYAQHRLYGNGSSVTSDGYPSGTFGFGFAIISLTNGVPASTYATMITDIQDYSSTTRNKTVRSFYGQDQNGSGIVGLSSSLWLNTAAITSILLRPYSGTFATGTTFSLYGIKG